MAFWTDQGFEPKRNFMWRLKLADGNIEPFRLTKVGRPKFSVSKKEHNYLNRKFNFPGLITWDNVTATVIDDVSGQSIKTLKEGIIAGGYADLDSTGTITDKKFETMNKSRMVDSIASSGRTMVIEQLDSDGNIVESYTLYNPWVVSLAPSELDYSNEDLSTYEIELSYDWASINVASQSE